MENKPDIRIEVFNGPAITVGAETVRRFPTRHCAALLAMLALAPGRRLTRDEIADTLWPDEALDASRRRIREHLYQLRKTIPNGRELIVSDGEFICLSQAFKISVDVLEFENLLSQAAQTEDNDRKAKLLVKADTVHNGPFAPELDWPRFDGLRVRYAQMHVELLRALSLLFAETDFNHAIEYGKRAVAADPLYEGAHEELIRLFVHAGKPEDARRQYRELEKTLRKELGTEPSREITQFIRSINDEGTRGPIPRLLRNSPLLAKEGVGGGLRARRAIRVYGAVAAISLILAFVTLVAAKPWRHPPTPPLTPEQRIIHIQQLRAKIAAAHTQSERDRFQKEQADECVELGEEAWKAWWGPDEEIWVNRLKLIDDDIENSLEWLAKEDPSREIQLSGALARYWVFPEAQLDKEAHWLALVTKYDGVVDDRIKARALTGLSRSYLTHKYDSVRAQEKGGLKAAQEAFELYGRCDYSWGQAHALRYVALHRHFEYDDVGAIRDFRDALDRFKRIRDERGQAQTYESMCYIRPEDSSGTVTPAERLDWAISAAKLYRKIRNPLGIVEGRDTLFKAAIQTPANLQTREGLRAVERECREQLSLAEAQSDLPHQREIWVALADVALKLNDKQVQAQCLIPLIVTKPRDRFNPEYEGIVGGAYSRYRMRDPDAKSHLHVFQSSLASDRTTHHGLRWNACVKRGRELSLHQAVVYAISH